jgi:serine/threonine protein kinase
VALDAELNREVALKEIQDRHADDPSSRSRFLVEAEITGGLEHPGIVPVYGLGTYANGRPFYAMRLIRGDSLKEAVATFHADGVLKRDRGKRALALRRLLRRFLDVCNVIDYAHSRGVLHRDLKPGNIIIGKHGETLVVDWGLAKATGKSDPSGEEGTLIPSLATGSAETLPGSTLGTPAYMSPEQARGDSERLGPRSDVYSLGATLYYLLTGKPPVENDDIHSVLRAVQRGELRPPRQLEPSTDKALEAVCLKAMALNEADRYSRPRALAEDIERWTADEPVSAFREGLLPRILRWMRRHPAAIPLASFIALCDGIVLFTVFANILSSRDIRISFPFVVFRGFHNSLHTVHWCRLTMWGLGWGRRWVCFGCHPLENPERVAAGWDHGDQDRGGLWHSAWGHTRRDYCPTCGNGLPLIGQASSRAPLPAGRLPGILCPGHRGVWAA